ncbi:unnamed protein product [Tuber melanosporum]|uniref:(Perigord truffle) hypothetical protein n=1 Tax=Tuber melanosporum (strain Mel28) TaxID=656061 RepID=D5G9P3_TUBMM|nr:uncharacterized protein GSTUM_00005006001 [Tuber melanosporum]CAZ81236.1 unnamed protein product [Tuber melanosporum]
MKHSFITFISLFLFLICGVFAAPATLDSAEIAKRDTRPLDIILADTRTAILARNSICNATNPATTADVTTYCDDIITIIDNTIIECGTIPPGTLFTNINLISLILWEILCDINWTLRLILSRCGLLGGLLALILILIGGLISALNLLIATIAGLCIPGLLALLLGLCGPGFWLITCGLII